MASDSSRRDGGHRILRYSNIRARTSEGRRHISEPSFLSRSALINASLTARISASSAASRLLPEIAPPRKRGEKRASTNCAQHALRHSCQFHRMIFSLRASSYFGASSSEAMVVQFRTSKRHFADGWCPCETHVDNFRHPSLRLNTE